MENLKKETINILTDNKKTLEDVQWCGSEAFGWFSIEDFIRLADFDYDSGYGGQDIATDLLVVGDNWWLERHEYDGSEWWEFKRLPVKPVKENVPTTLDSSDSWATLEEQTREGGKYN